MPIRADQLREVTDYQRLIINYLRDVNGFVERDSSNYSAGLAMDKELLFEFLEQTQHESMESLRRMYQDRTEETIIALLNSEVNRMNGKLISRGLIDVLKRGLEFDNGVKLNLMYRKPDSTRNTDAVEKYKNNIFSVMELTI